MKYTIKGNLKSIRELIYMSFLTPTKLVILTIDSRTMDIFSSYLIEQ